MMDATARNSDFPTLTLNDLDVRAPIGIFDSGVGGLSVARHIYRELPTERLLYIADSAHAPYGSKSAAEVEERAMKLSGYLIERRVKVLVVACNTATAAAIRRLRSLHTIPVVGMEPALKPAAAMTRTGVVGVLATAGTLNSDKFTRLQAKYGREVRIIAQPCPGLAEQVENGNLTGIATRELVEFYLGKLIFRGVDTLVLGCTHYPFLLPLIREISGPHIRILDTGFPVTKEVRRRLEAKNLLAEKGQTGGLEIRSNGDTKLIEENVARLWGSPINVKSLDGLDRDD